MEEKKQTQEMRRRGDQWMERGKNGCREGGTDRLKHRREKHGGREGGIDGWIDERTSECVW